VTMKIQFENSNTELTSKIFISADQFPKLSDTTELYRTVQFILDSIHRLVYRTKKPQRFGNRSSLRNVVVSCPIYQTMDIVQNKPNSSVQHTRSSEYFQVYNGTNYDGSNLILLRSTVTKDGVRIVNWIY
jgi:hypothetical protein